MPLVYHALLAILLERQLATSIHITSQVHVEGVHKHCFFACICHVAAQRFTCYSSTSLRWMWKTCVWLVLLLSHCPRKTQLLHECLAERAAERTGSVGPCMQLQTLHGADLNPHVVKCAQRAEQGSSGPNNADCCQQGGADWTNVARSAHHPCSALFVVCCAV